MTGNELIERLELLSEEERDRVVVLSDRSGWSNIDYIEIPDTKKDSTIKLVAEEYPIFSDN